MLLNRATAEGIRDGSVTVVFRRWEVPRARPGGTQRTVAGVIRFVSVEPVAGELTDDDARSAGLPSVQALRKADRGNRAGRLYRIGVTFDRPDERVSLRDQLPSASDVTAIDDALDRLDRGRRTGPWTREMLGLIASRPEVRAPELAASLGRETRPFKADVRKLKELGLTRSLKVGYELSSRGRAYLDRAVADQTRPDPTRPDRPRLHDNRQSADPDRSHAMHPNSTAVATALAKAGAGGDVRELTESARTAAEAAAALGCDIGAIANSLVFMADDEPVLILTSGSHRVDTGHVAGQLGVAALRRATPEQVRAATGQPIGGVAPVGHPHPVRTLVDVALAAYPVVWAAGGTPRTVFPTSYPELLRICSARPITVTGADDATGGPAG